MKKRQDKKWMWTINKMIEVRQRRSKHNIKYIECRIYKEQILKNRKRKCTRCRDQTISSICRGQNNEDGNDEIEILREQLGQTLQYNNEINRKNYDLKNQGYIDSKKDKDCVRILALNPRGFGPNTMEKVNMMKKAMEEKEIDIVLLSSADREWTEYRVEQMKKMFRSIDNKVEVIASDSGEKSRSDEGYLPGGTLSIYTGKMAGMIQKENSRMDKLGRWTSTRVEGEHKAM